MYRFIGEFIPLVSKLCDKLIIWIIFKIVFLGESETEEHGEY